MGSDPLLCDNGVVSGVGIVGAGNGAGARFRDWGWRGGDATGGDVANFGDVACGSVGMGAGVGMRASSSAIPPEFFGVAGRSRLSS